MFEKIMDIITGICVGCICLMVLGLVVWVACFLFSNNPIIGM